MKKKHSDHIRQSVKKVYNEIATEFSSSRHYQWAEFKYFKPYIKPGNKVLDLGCGNGRLYEFLAPQKIDYLGIDQSEGLISEAQKNYSEAKFQLGDMLSTDLPSGHFDVILSIAAFHHIPGKKLRKKAAKEMYRLLKKEGVLILTVWNLFQKKYRSHLLKAIFSFLIHFGLKYSWNDLWIKWSKHPLPRYYHAFLPTELTAYFQQDWQIEDFFFVKKGKKVSFLKSFNLCLILRKK